MATKDSTHALRGPALTFVDDPFRAGIEAAMRYESDAIVAMAGRTSVRPARCRRTRERWRG